MSLIVGSEKEIYSGVIMGQKICHPLMKHYSLTRVAVNHFHKEREGDKSLIHMHYSECISLFDAIVSKTGGHNFLK